MNLKVWRDAQAHPAFLEQLLKADHAKQAFSIHGCTICRTSLLGQVDLEYEAKLCLILV